MSTVQISCPHCGLSKSIARERITAGKKKVTCPECKQFFLFSLDDTDSESQPATPRIPPINKVALLLFTFFLGGVGGHKFYLRKYLQGLLYLLFFWTAIPSLVAFVEFILYACRSEADLQRAHS